MNNPHEPARFWVLTSILLAANISGLAAMENPQDLLRREVEAQHTSLEELYRHFHSNPELSAQEFNTARRLAAELREAGYEVREGFGLTGVVGLLENGRGPIILLRADMDALPVEEETGLAYASEVTVTDGSGRSVPVMHACGHDIHMTVLVGAARVLSALRDQWQGRLVLIGQPAEEVGKGAKSMLGAGLYREYSVPDYAFAFHVSASLPAGKIGYVSGYAMANVDSVDITVKGIGGHGAYPHMTKDPIILAGQILVALQTIVSRETSPLEPVVVTVGSIHGGTKHNIIPKEVALQLTVRTYSDESRERTIQAIRRIVAGIAATAGLPKELEPEVQLKDEYTPSLYNDPQLVERLAHTIERVLGRETVIPVDPVMAGEDFGRYGRTEDGVPIALFWLGSVHPALWDESQRSGRSLPSLHSPRFVPTPAATIRTGVLGMVSAVLELAAPDRPSQ